MREAPEYEGRYAVDGWAGIAFYVYGWETQPTEDTWWDGVEEDTGNLLLVMVCDDRQWSVDPSDLTPLSDEDYCSECGQIGCKADGR